MSITAFIMALTREGKEYSVLKELRRMKKISEAWLVYGEYDVVCRAVVKDLTELEKLVTEKIRNIPHITMTNTMINL